MTRRANRFFVIMGVAGFGTLVGLIVLSNYGYKEEVIRPFLLDHVGYLLFPSFFSLLWFGLMPRAGTWMYLQGGFDHPRRNYMFELALYRFLFLITDDPRVVARRRGQN
ncbi:hypothetical protein ACHMW7_10535 [Aminobacter sp. UC22_36]|uniref:hypothetical protein n=1 Tax=Aminobacter sp. UC22_36 TaxID=3374549 RepID=UPI00375822F4